MKGTQHFLVLKKKFYYSTKIVVHVCLPLSSLDRKCFNDYLLCAK